MYKYLFPLIGVVIESMSDVLLKSYVQNNNINFLYLGILGYSLTAIFFVKLLKIHNLGTSNMLWHISHFIILFLISVFYFKEKYNKNDMLALMFGALSLYFASHKHH